MRNLKDGQFLASDIDVAKGATLVEGTDFTSNEIEVSDVEQIIVSIYGTPANASIDSTLDVWFGVAVDGATYDSGGEAENRYTMTQLRVTAASKQVASDPITVTGVRRIKVIKIINNDANYKVESANILYGKQEVV